MLMYSNGDFKVDKTTQSDIIYVSDNIRKTDAIEIYMSDKSTPYTALQLSVQRSDEAYTIKHKDIPFAIFGIANDKVWKENAVIWLLGTNEITSHKKEFHSITKLYLAYFHSKSKILFNFVMANNYVALNWLEKLGAKFSSATPYGALGALFKYFELRGD